MHEFFESDAVAPAELIVRLSRIADQVIDFRRAEISRIDLDEHFSGILIYALLLYALPLPNDRASDMDNAFSTNSRTECASPVAST